MTATCTQGRRVAKGQHRPMLRLSVAPDGTAVYRAAPGITRAQVASWLRQVADQTEHRDSQA